MAVTRVFGRVDGTEVVLQHIDGNRWSVPVPFDKDCEYLMELYAEDEAGNVSYLTQALFTYDPKALVFKIAPIQYDCKLLPEPYEINIIPERKERMDSWIV